MKWIILAVVIVAVLVVLTRRRTPRTGEILPASELQREYGLYAENRPDIDIDADEVPERLRDLIPMAEKWGIGDDVIRGDFEKKASHEEKTRFQQACRGRMDQVTVWLDSYNNTDNMMPEAATYFMNMQQALDEMGLWED